MDDRSMEAVYMYRHMGFFKATGTIVGGMIGTGIFLTPKGVAEHMGSVGATLIIWALCGVINTIGAIAFLELGAMLPHAGGHYAFIYEGFGPLGHVLAFSTVWADIVLNSPAMLVILGRTGGTYLVSYADPLCGVIPVIINSVSLFAILTFAYLSCLNIDIATRVQAYFSVGKVLALIMIIIAGIVKLSTGSTRNFESSRVWLGTMADFGAIALASYQGYYAYSGWENLFILQEEIKNPAKTLVRSVVFSMAIITIIYTMTNIAYFSVMTPSEMVASPAVALTFAERAMKPVLWFVSVCVALSALGSCIGSYLISSRVAFRCGRDGNMPLFLSMLNVTRKTPIPAIVITILLSIAFHAVPDIGTLVGYSTLISQVRVILCFTSFLILRWTKPDLERPVKVSILFPVVALLFNLAFLVTAVVRDPRTYAVGLALWFTFLPAYLFNRFVAKKYKIVSTLMDAVTIRIQSLLQVIPEEKGLKYQE